MGTKIGIAKVKILKSGSHIHIQTFLKNPLFTVVQQACNCIPFFLLLQTTENKCTTESALDFIMEPNQFCGICLEMLDAESNSTTLAVCGHCFCNGCWIRYLGTEVKLGHVNITCPVSFSYT